MNTAVYLLRAVQVGLTICDLNQLDVGTVLDIVTESANDRCQYDQVATQSDFDRF